MRLRAPLLAALLIASSTSAGSAAELLYCDDGRVLKVDNTNRVRLSADPCVKAWFAASQPRPEPPRTLAERRRAFLAGSSLPPPNCCCCSLSRFVVIFSRWH